MYGRQENYQADAARTYTSHTVRSSALNAHFAGDRSSPIPPAGFDSLPPGGTQGGAQAQATTGGCKYGVGSGGNCMTCQDARSKGAIPPGTNCGAPQAGSGGGNLVAATTPTTTATTTATATPPSQPHPLTGIIAVVVIAGLLFWYFSTHKKQWNELVEKI